jgi:hypothetical protein
MSRSLWVPICFAASVVSTVGFVAPTMGCGDPYVAPHDGGPSGTPDPDSAPGTDSGTPGTDSGTPPGEDTSVKPDLGPPGTPCPSAGKSESSPCGKCGTQTRICQSSLSWSDWSICSGEGICSPGESDSAACGTSGTKTRSCTSSCSWGSYGSCIGDAPTCGTLGATGTQACGKCGTQSRTCMSSGWSSWGACTGEGVCTPYTTDSATCTGGGTKTRSCDSTCNWGSYGTCVGGTTTGCASGYANQTYSTSTYAGMWGCSGSVAYTSASTLCASGMHACSSAEFNSRRGYTTPNHHYWVSDYLYGSGVEGACKASTSSSYGNFCPTTAPMRVCASVKTDTSGNFCTWVACGLESTTSTLLFGGCNDGTVTGSGLKAGTLCCN